MAARRRAGARVAPATGRAAGVEVPRSGPAQTRDVPVIAGARAAALGPWAGAGAFPSFVRDANPDTLTFEQYDEMRRDPTIAAGLTMVKAPILGMVRRAGVQCDDPAVAAAVEEVFLKSGLLYQAVRAMLSAEEFGVAFMEKVWAREDLDIWFGLPDPNTGEPVEQVAFQGPALVIRQLRHVNPATVTEIRRRHEPRDGKPGDGSFDGFVQRVGADEVWVQPPYAFVYSRNPEFGNLWGAPRTKPAYPYYVWKQVILKYWMAWTEKKAVPPRIARHPVGVNARTGQDNAEVAVQVATAVDNVAAVALPSTRDQSNNYLWTLEELSTTDRTDVFERTVRALDGALLRAIFVPERSFLEGQYGTKAEAEAHTDTFLLTEDERLVDMLEAFSRYVVQPWIDYNFGPDAARARIVCPGLTDEERALLREVLMALLSAPAMQERVDLGAIAERYGVPLKPAPAPTPDAGAMDGGVGAGAEDNGAAGQNGEESGPAAAPPNLVLSDAMQAVVSLAAEVDLSRYTITPDDSASGYRVIDRRTGQRLIGFAARQVVKAFQNAQKKAAAQAERAARQAQRERERAAKKAQREQERAARQAERERKRVEQAIVQAARAERRELEARTRTLDPDLAEQVIRRAGWAVEGDVAPDLDQAVRAAEAVAADNPDLIVSAVRVKGGFVVVTKAKNAITPRGQGPANVAMVDLVEASLPRTWDAALAALAEEAGEPVQVPADGHDANVPGDATLELFTEAARRIAAFFGERPDLDDVDVYPDSNPDDRRSRAPGREGNSEDTAGGVD